MSDYRVTVKVRNARILQAIEKEGHESVAEFCRVWALRADHINALICMREAPVGEDGRLKVKARTLCDVLCLLPEDLWTETQLYQKHPRCTSYVDVSEDALEQTIRQIDAERTIKFLEQGLTPSQLTAIGRIGKEQSLKQSGETLGVSQERARQIEAKAIRKMRGVARKTDLIDQFAGEY